VRDVGLPKHGPAERSSHRLRQNPTMPTLPATTAFRASDWMDFARRGLRVALAGLLISMVLALVLGGNAWKQVIYSTCIAVFCWFFIDGGRLLAAHWRLRLRGGQAPSNMLVEHWPGWGVMLLVVPLGTVLGFSAGTMAGNLITGGAQPGLLQATPRSALLLLVISLIPGIGATYYFYSRGRMAAIEAQAQAAQRLAAENQLRLLESQLEPHMLFNTLANLRVLIGMDPPRAQAMLDRLIGFLRSTLDASRAGRHELRAEFDRVADYLALMEVRMGDRLTQRLDLPDGLADAPVPPLLLQPLVENAIKHGLEPKVAGGCVQVRAERDGAHLVLTVQDDGVGLGNQGTQGTRFGLQQVRERLATLYGTGASLTLESAPAGSDGTVAVVRLPLGLPQ
jgi:signal transduction histidine kinase